MKDKITPNSTTIHEALIDADATAASRVLARVNGSGQFGGNAETSAPSTSNATFNLQLGAAGNNVLPMTGDICEIILYSQHPTEAAQTAIRQYLAAKWGVTLA